MSISQKESMVPVDGDSQIYIKEKWQENTPGGPAVLMIHGYNASASVGNYDIPVKDFSGMELLAARGYDVFALDMRGFGKSSHPEQLTWEDNVNDISAAVAFIRKTRQVERLSIVGGSYGGPIAYTFASRFPDLIERLVLMCAPYRTMRPEGRAMINALITMTEQQNLTYLPGPGPREKDSGVVEPDPEVFKWRLAASQSLDNRVPVLPMKKMIAFEAAQAVPGITAPTRVVVGDRDFIVAVEDSLCLLKDLGSTEKSLVVIGNAGHGLMYETKRLYIWSQISQGLPPIGEKA